MRCWMWKCILCTMFCSCNISSCFFFFLIYPAQLGIVIVQELSHVQLFATQWTAACQASLSFTISQSLLKLMCTESMILSDHLILCCPLFLLPSIFPSFRVFSNISTSYHVAKVLELQLQHQSFQWISRLVLKLQSTQEKFPVPWCVLAAEYNPDAPSFLLCALSLSLQTLLS